MLLPKFSKEVSMAANFYGALVPYIAAYGENKETYEQCVFPGLNWNVADSWRNEGYFNGSASPAIYMCEIYLNTDNNGVRNYTNYFFALNYDSSVQSVYIRDIWSYVVTGVGRVYWYGNQPKTSLVYDSENEIYYTWGGTQGWKVGDSTGGQLPSGAVPFFDSYEDAVGALKTYLIDGYDPYQNITNPTSPGGGPIMPSVEDPFKTDDIEKNLLPEVSAVGTGFVSLWCPTEQQMLDLSTYMWNADARTLDFWRKLIADPIQLIYGLNIIPLNLRNYGIVGSASEEVVVGTISTGIEMDYLTKQWVEVDCGTIDIEELMGAYLDYDPFTRMDIYLPYIGYRSLRVDDFMPGQMSVSYKVDLLTGTCVAQIKSTKSAFHEDKLNSVIYQFMGNCAAQVPVSAQQYADAVRSAITTAAAIGTVALLAGSGAGGAVAAGMGAEIMPSVSPIGLLAGPGIVPVDSTLGMQMESFAATQAAWQASPSVSSGGGSSLKDIGMMRGAASAAENVMGIKPSVERSGAIGGAGGMLCIQKPYIVITRPRVAHPEDQNKYTGYPSFMTQKLSALSGFTQIEAIHLEFIPCTATELAELESLLKGGVIF